MITVVEPHVELLTPVEHLLQYPKLIEQFGRTCYKSEDKINNDSAKRFIRSIIKRGHESVIEHCVATYRFVCSRSCSHQLVRHRIAAFCLSGDTTILRHNTNKENLTIRELYFRQQDPQLRGRNKLLLLRSMTPENTLVPNRMINVTFSGNKRVKKISTDLGYTISATDEHIFFGPKGEIKLKDIKVGDKLVVNGEPLYQITLCTVTSIDQEGTIDTYDIEMEAPHHNFIANGFVVHNSQESQRYCDYGKLGFQVIAPPSIMKDPINKHLFLDQCEEAYSKYLQLRQAGIPPEDARFVLPNASKTEVVTTFNLRQWRHTIKERGLNPHAQWEIKSLFRSILYELNHYIPVFFEDLVSHIA